MKFTKMIESLDNQSAYSQMVNNVPVVRLHWTLQKSHDYFVKNVSDFESIRYLYVTDEDRKFVGVLSVKDIFRHDLKKLVSDVCKKNNLVYVFPHTNQGKAVYLALKYTIKAVPVVSEDMTFLGVVPSDRILSIVYKEAKSSVLRFAGIPQAHVTTFDSVMSTPIWVSFRHRIPWLIIGILGGFLSAQIIGGFEATIEKNIILAAFIPLIVYISDAVGTQMEAYIIRELALEEEFSFLKYFFKQLVTTWLIALVCGTILFLITAVHYNDILLATVLSISLFIAVSSAILTGMVIPYVLSKLKIDPASASGPIATIIQDMLSVVVYFTVATALLP